MSEFKNEFEKQLHMLKEYPVIEMVLEEAKKEFPMEDIDDSQGYGGSSMNILEEIWIWFEKWFGEGE
jgi:hypothetical protein